MTSGAPRQRIVPMRIVLIVSVCTSAAALVVLAQRIAANRRPPPEPPPELSAAQSTTPIAHEARVFRARAITLAIEPALGPRRAAHPRTLATFRSLRAYPGAPPRIPHGLTPSEWQTGGCKTCHERGGFSQRFGAYVPVTPHPEMGACLQCHVGDGKLMAIALPSTDPNTRCRQCHAPGAARWRDSTLEWKPSAWPSTAPYAQGMNPPAIPHPLEFRGDCAACHSGPAGVAEIQTRHPERANCRQCHVVAGPERDPFVRRARRPVAEPRDIP